MNKVYFHGALKDKYGGPYDVAAKRPVEAIRFLSHQLKGLRSDLVGGEFQVVSGPKDKGMELDEVSLMMPIAGELHVIPVLEGSGGKGGKLILGIALIGIGFYGALGSGLAGAFGVSGAMQATAFSVFGQSVTWGRIAMTGAALALSGVAQMLSPTPKSNYGGREKPDARPSFLMSGAVNTLEQGGAVSLVYGKYLTGSKVVSAGLSVEQM